MKAPGLTPYPLRGATYGPARCLTSNHGASAGILFGRRSGSRARRGSGSRCTRNGTFPPERVPEEQCTTRDRHVGDIEDGPVQQPEVNGTNEVDNATVPARAVDEVA